MASHRTGPARLALVPLLALAAAPALAECGIEAGSVRILSNDFEALRVVNDAAAECASDTVTVTANATTEHKNIQVPALSVEPAEYTVAMVANNSIVPLLADGLIRPLDDLVAEYGQDLDPGQLIRIDGHVMAVAFMANGQHLWVREDLLAQAGITETPTTYEGVLAAAQALRDQGILENPLAAQDGSPWHLAAEFVNMYLGTGAEFFEPGTATLAIDNAEAREALQTMRDMTGFMAPEYVSWDSNAVGQLYRDGQVAIMNGWGSLAGATLDPVQTLPEVLENTAFAAAPTLGDGAVPAAALWWDGFTIAQNISDEDAEASFRAMLHGIRPEVAQAHADAAVWLIPGVQPGPAGVGVMANAQGGARAYPMVPYMGLLHEVLGAELADFIKGSEDADKAIADIEAAYDAAAQQAGYLQ